MIRMSTGAKKVLNMLRLAGYEAYAVGGCVRDMAMNKTASDFDITTNALPHETKSVFSKERIIETGIKHGTITVIIDGESVEVTTYRIDGKYSDSRHPESVLFTSDLKSDLSRRDFTMNALVYNDMEGMLDFFNGIEDIENKIIRAIGDPEKRFAEDALRIMRAIRFSSTLGFKIEEKTKEAMVKCKHLLKNISVERIAIELNKLLLGDNVTQVILENHEILGELCPELLKMKGFKQYNDWHVYDVLEHTAIAVGAAPKKLSSRLAMLFHDTGKVHTFTRDTMGVGHFYGHGEKSAEIVKEFLEKYKYDNATSELVYKLVKIHDLYTEENEVLIKKRLNRIGKELFLELIKIQRADNTAQNPSRSKKEYFDRLESMVKDIASRECFTLSGLNINGNDLIACGIKGRAIGNTLNILLQEVIENKLKNEKNALVRRALEII